MFLNSIEKICVFVLYFKVLMVVINVVIDGSNIIDWKMLLVYVLLIRRN